VIVFPNAKINLGLYVTSRRKDGYHNINTVFLPVKKLYDILEVILLQDEQRNDSFTVSGLSIPCALEDNLCLKAVKLMRRHIKIPPLNIFLHKIIPFGSGLGGGSSDAAFMLKLLNEMFEAGITDDNLENIASEIGADCAFFIRNKSVFAEGVGNIFSPLNSASPNLWIELIVPPIEVSTTFAYQNITPCKPDIDLKTVTKLPVDTWRNKIENHFEKFVFIKFPELQKIKETLYNRGAYYASMSGSGSAVYGLFKQNPKICWDKSYFVHSGCMQ
jgi:4-diphosphocytidyl-2-C-methyl-D-erythritol kinase